LAQLDYPELMVDYRTADDAGSQVLIGLARGKHSFDKRESLQNETQRRLKDGD
jgi:tmRNA-binding protein